LLQRFALPIAPVWVVIALVQCRLFELSGVSALPVALTAAAACLVSWVILLGAPYTPLSMFRRSSGSVYWVIVAAVVINLVAIQALGIIGAYSGLRVVTGSQYLLVAGLVMTVVSRGGLRPEKSW
jgi:hypothetical protein